MLKEPIIVTIGQYADRYHRHYFSNGAYSPSSEEACVLCHPAENKVKVTFRVAGESAGFPIDEEFTDAAEAEQRWRDLNSIEGSHVSVVETVVSEAK